MSDFDGTKVIIDTIIKKHFQHDESASFCDYDKLVFKDGKFRQALLYFIVYDFYVSFLLDVDEIDNSPIKEDLRDLLNNLNLELNGYFSSVLKML